MTYRHGQWLALCDVCGFRFHSGSLKRRWDGAMVCKDDYETRHPQEFVRGVPERQPAWTRPEPPTLNVSVFQYVDAGYWDNPSVVPPASHADQEYVES
jgi:hypothetical protein